MKLRIAKYLVSCGLGARRKCEKLITDSRVSVNGEIITSLGFKVDTEKDKGAVDDKEVKLQEKIYYLLNKPTGYTTTMADPHADKIITELVPKIPLVWPVGRLDKNTSGLIILTNDGELTQRLSHPKYEKEKEYLVSLNKPLIKKDFDNLKNGLTLEDGPIKPDSLKEKDGKYLIVIHEGRKRIVRRLFKSLGYNVTSLERVRISNITIEGLKTGEYRELTNQEVERLLNA